MKTSRTVAMFLCAWWSLFTMMRMTVVIICGPRTIITPIFLNSLLTKRINNAAVATTSIVMIITIITTNVMYIVFLHAAGCRVAAVITAARGIRTLTAAVVTTTFTKKFFFVEHTTTLANALIRVFHHPRVPRDVTRRPAARTSFRRRPQVKCDDAARGLLLQPLRRHVFAGAPLLLLEAIRALLRLPIKRRGHIYIYFFLCLFSLLFCFFSN